MLHTPRVLGLALNLYIGETPNHLDWCNFIGLCVEDGSGWSRIFDYEDGIDTLRFSDPAVSSIHDLRISDRPDRSVLIQYSGGAVRIDGIDARDLWVDDFLF